jgi:hypothetical protein
MSWLRSWTCLIAEKARKDVYGAYAAASSVVLAVGAMVVQLQLL